MQSLAFAKGERRYRAGTYGTFAGDSHHRPRTEIWLRLFSFNLAVH